MKESGFVILNDVSDLSFRRPHLCLIYLLYTRWLCIQYIYSICKSAFCKLHFSFLDFFLYSMFGDFNFPSFYVFHIEFFNFQPWVVIQKLSLSLCIFLSIFYIFQIEFFNYQPWVVIQKLSLPLCIFFRCFILPVNSCGFSRVCFA